MIPNYAYWGLPNYTKFINNQTPIVPPQPNIAQAYANSPKFSVMPTYFQETPNYRSNYKYRNTNDNNNYSLKSSSIDMNSNNVINNIKNNRDISKKFHKTSTSFENTSSQNIPLKNTGSNRSESGNYEPVFNLLGINLYFDDILILCLLFFLYTEQANDFSLYLALIFLLMC